MLNDYPKNEDKYSETLYSSYKYSYPWAALRIQLAWRKYKYNNPAKVIQKAWKRYVYCKYYACFKLPRLPVPNLICLHPRDNINLIPYRLSHSFGNKYFQMSESRKWHHVAKHEMIKMPANNWCKPYCDLCDRHFSFPETYWKDENMECNFHLCENCYSSWNGEFPPLNPNDLI